MKAGDLLFVYGTLRPGAGGMSLDRDKRVEHVGKDHINGRLYNMGYYPGAIIDQPGNFDPGKDFIEGDVFRILDQSIISHLDAYEGYPNLYGRIQTESGEKHIVWVYTYNHDVLEEQRIVGGDWLNRPRNPNLIRRTA